MAFGGPAVNVGPLALMAVVTWQLSRTSIVDPWTALLAAGSLLLALLRFKLNSYWLVLIGAIAGLLLHGFVR